MSKYFSSPLLSSSDYIERKKNIEMIKITKLGKPTRNYKIKGDRITQYINYDTYLSLVKGYYTQPTLEHNGPPITIMDGTTSYKCGNSCEKSLFPYGKYVNQKPVGLKGYVFPAQITTSYRCPRGSLDCLETLDCPEH